MLDYQLQEMKEEVRRLEVAKREFIHENKQTKPERITDKPPWLAIKYELPVKSPASLPESLTGHSLFDTL